MKELGENVEEILKYLKEKRSVKREDIKDKFGLEKEKMEQILKFLLDLEFIEVNNQVKMTESGLDFLQL